MRGRSQGVVAFVMAYAVMVILVSPAVPSPVTIVPVKHTVQSPYVVAHVAALHSTAAAYDPGVWHEVALMRPPHPTASGCDIVDVTTARLC